VALACLLAGVALISTSAILVTLSGSPPTVSAFYRNAFAAVVWLPVLFVGARKGNPHPVFHYGRKTWGMLVLLGFFFAVDLWAWHRAIFALGAGPATLVGNFQVFFVALLGAAIFHEKLGRYYWPGTVLALAGIALLTLPRGFGGEVAWGLLMGLITALTFGAFLLVMKAVMREAIALSALLFWVAFLSAGFLLVPAVLEGHNPLAEPWEAMGWLALHAFLSSVVGWWLIAAGMKRLPVWLTSTLILLQPVLTTVQGWVILDQTLGVIQIAGIAVTLGGIRLAALPAPAKEGKREGEEAARLLPLE
jgi:drug/metabolite transporter (DMT)-like permease